jgi:chromosome segregation ATPase
LHKCNDIIAIAQEAAEIERERAEQLLADKHFSQLEAAEQTRAHLEQDIRSLQVDKQELSTRLDASHRSLSEKEDNIAKLLLEAIEKQQIRSELETEIASLQAEKRGLIMKLDLSNLACQSTSQEVVSITAAFQSSQLTVAALQAQVLQYP